MVSRISPRKTRGEKVFRENPPELWSMGLPLVETLVTMIEDENDNNLQTGNETMTAAQINQMSVAQFGYDATTIDPTAALWLAERILASTGKNVYRRVSAMRNKAGKGTSFPAFGTALFAAI